jgi:hypothetical protein
LQFYVRPFGDRPFDRGFHRSHGRHGQSMPSSCQIQSDASAVLGVPGPTEQSSRREALHDARQCAGVHVQRPGKSACRQTRICTDHPEHQALWPRDTEFRVHATGGSIERVIDRPHQAHELEHLTKAGDGRLAADC